MEDPFRHHPGLRGRIKPAKESFFRNLDLAVMDARAEEIGRPPDWRTPCEEREAGRLQYLKGRMGSDLWVFGYGSLMWDPAMEFAEVRRAKSRDYLRSFCLWDEGGRGSPAQPGLMLAIDTVKDRASAEAAAAGVCCEGIAFRIEAEKLDHETFVLFRREMIAKAYQPVWLNLETDFGEIEALSFAANHENERIKPGIPLDQQAEMISRAEGILGTNYDYLVDTHAHLDLLGIEDPYIADLHLRVNRLRADKSSA